MTSKTTVSALRRAGGFATFAGALFGIAGAAAWGTVTKQLRDERITVPDNAPVFAGRRVQDPATAYVEALVIKRNAERGADGRTFSDISEALKHCEKGGDEERKLRGQSASLAAAAGLRTSLMTSVLAYGVSALVASLGGLLVIMGSLLRKTDRV